MNICRAKCAQELYYIYFLCKCIKLVEILQLKKQSMHYEDARKKEEPMVDEVDAEVNKLKQSIQDYNKEQMLMRNQAKELKEKADAMDSKVCH